MELNSILALSFLKDKDPHLLLSFEWGLFLTLSRPPAALPIRIPRRAMSSLISSERRGYSSLALDPERLGNGKALCLDFLPSLLLPTPKTAMSSQWEPGSSFLSLQDTSVPIGLWRPESLRQWVVD